MKGVYVTKLCKRGREEKQKSAEELGDDRSDQRRRRRRLIKLLAVTRRNHTHPTQQPSVSPANEREPQINSASRER